MAEKVLTGSWVDDRKIFTGLVKLFVSRVGSVGPGTANARYKALVPTVAKRIAHQKV